MSAEVVDLDAHRPVWRVVKARCRFCYHTCVSTQHVECTLDNAECPTCLNMTCAVTHYLLSDGSWEPRLRVCAPLEEALALEEETRL